MIPSEDVLRKYLEAGRIAAKVREEAARFVEPGKSLLEICETIEQRIRDLGGEPAFPCNISVNYVAAHYTPVISDDSRIPEEAVVKLDIGVHIDGYIADTAITVTTNPSHEPLLEAVREALEKALENVKPGQTFRDIGRIVEETIRRHGYRPIINLSGHSLGEYTIHAGDTIPNFDDPRNTGSFQPGKAYAIEPFATNGQGLVYEGSQVTIYALMPRTPRRRLTPREKKLLAQIASRFRTLPFTERWLADQLNYYGGLQALRMLLRKLANMGYLIQYPVLIERSRGLVAQFEHTVLVLKDQVIVTTQQ